MCCVICYKTNVTTKLVSCESGFLHHFRSPVYILQMMFTQLSHSLQQQSDKAHCYHQK